MLELQEKVIHEARQERLMLLLKVILTYIIKSFTLKVMAVR